MPCRVTLKRRAGSLPRIDKWRQITDQILDFRQIAKRFNRQGVVLNDVFDMRATGPSWFSIYGHRAGAAHSDAAGEPVSQRGFEAALDFGDDIEHGLVFAGFDLIVDQTTCFMTSPDFYLENLAGGSV